MATASESQHQKNSLCKLLRGTACCFIEQTVGTRPREKSDASRLRHEVDCLITLYESGLIDPVAALQSAPLHPSEEAPLTGTHA